MITARRKEAPNVKPCERLHTQEPVLNHIRHFMKQERSAHGFAGGDHVIEGDGVHERRLRDIL